MISRNARAAVIAGALLSIAGWQTATAQVTGKATVGRVFSLHTDKVGACPSLDWHIVVGPDNTLYGMIGADDMNVVFNVKGTFNPADGTFQLTGKEAGGTRTGAINGVVRRSQRVLVATLGGLPVDAPCQGKTVYVKSVPPYNAYSSAGLAGGGG